MISLQNAAVLVVGGTQGMGFAAARMAAEAGAKVTVASRTLDKVHAAAARIGHGAHGAVIDVTDDASVDRFFAAHPEWDHVVVSAASVAIQSIKKLPLADAKASMDSKFWGAYRIARAVKIRPPGSLTLVSGGASVRPFPNAALVGVLNAAVENLALGLALELRPVRVNCVSPGMVDTEAWDSMPADRKHQMFAKIAGNLPAGVVGQPDDIAMQILCYMQNPFATGSIAHISGGGLLV
jgi:NAD(P)-dependent dehydrogenase (short-subunit alcohol dehydrogenase family)